MKMKFVPADLDTNDIIVVCIVLAASFMFVGAMIYALAWSVRDGQFENFSRSAKAIFDADEPIGVTTDAFPGQPERRKTVAEEPTPL